MSRLADEGRAQLKVLVGAQTDWVAALATDDLRLLAKADKARQLASEAMEAWFERVAEIDYGD